MPLPISQTPLRYPGGKRRLIPVITRILEHNRLRDIQYVEGYAGGAAVALSLLFDEYASIVHMNDLASGVFAFWHAVLNDTAELCYRIATTKITMREWYRQREVYANRESASLLDLAFATFFLNRTNRSGIIAGGVIGGKQQSGDWKLDVRFNKDDLIKRIRKIGRYRNRIRLYQLDGLQFATTVLPQLGSNVFTFYDPPYIENGAQLYLNDYTLEGHFALAEAIQRTKTPWVVTYDYSAIRHRLYEGYRRVVYDIHYSAQDRYRGKEVLFISHGLRLPKLTELLGPRTKIVPFKSRIHSRHVLPVLCDDESMKSHPEMDEGPQAGERFLRALKTVLAVRKKDVPNPFHKPPRKRKKPASRKS
jgi:DNA adenine methylase